MNVSHPGCPGSRAVERVCFSFIVSKASIPSWCLKTTNDMLFVMLMRMCLSVHTWSVHMEITAMLCRCREFHGVSML